MFFNPIYNNILQFDIFRGHDSFFDFSTTCRNGHSKGNYASFNLGEYSGDDIRHVTQNRMSLASILNIDLKDLYLPYQTHGDKIVHIDKNFLSLTDQKKKEKLNGIDALITDEKGVCVGVTTADCVPLLIFDSKKNVVAAVHAGWRSTVVNIAAKVIRHMQDIYGCSPADIKAGIAPAISQNRFEVGEEVAGAFIDAGFSLEDIGNRNNQTGKMHIDLPYANKLLLRSAGLLDENIEMSGLCTYSDPDAFFSARRQMIHSGRMVTGGVLY